MQIGKICLIVGNFNLEFEFIKFRHLPVCVPCLLKCLADTQTLSHWPEKNKRRFPLARAEGAISERN